MLFPSTGVQRLRERVLRLLIVFLSPQDAGPLNRQQRLRQQTPRKQFGFIFLQACPQSEKHAFRCLAIVGSASLRGHDDSTTFSSGELKRGCAKFGDNFALDLINSKAPDTSPGTEVSCTPSRRVFETIQQKIAGDRILLSKVKKGYCMKNAICLINLFQS